jgi:hypothetical protein
MTKNLTDVIIQYRDCFCLKENARKKQRYFFKRIAMKLVKLKNESPAKNRNRIQIAPNLINIARRVQDDGKLLVLLSSFQPEENCPICFDSLRGAANIAFQACSHSIHFACFRPFELHKCPICREHIV